MKRRYWGLPAALVVAAGIVAAGCTSAGASPGASQGTGPGTSAASATATDGGSFSVVDALGRTVKFANPPSRIAIAGKASFLVADAVYMFPEASSRVVALCKTTQGSVDFISAIDPAYADKTILDGNAGADQVAAVKPDAVIAKSSSKQSLGDPLEAIGISVVYVDFETPDQYTRDLATLGALFGDPARARQLTAYFSDQMSKVKAGVAGLANAEKPDVLLLYYSAKNGVTAFQVPPLSYIQSVETEISGANPAWKGAQLGNGWTTVSLEQIAAWNPDQIYVIAYFDNPADVAKQVLSDPQWQGLAAVTSRSVYGFPGDYYSWDEPDPRWALGMTWLAIHVNPALADRLDMRAEVRVFYATVYGLSGADFETKIRPQLPAEFR